MMFRRLAMLQIKRQKAEPSRDFTRRLADAGDQCDLDNMSRHDFQIMCLIHNMEDDNLKSKLRKVRQPTWQGMLEKCEDHDRSRMTFDRAQNSHHEQSRQVTSAKGQTSGRKMKNKNKKGVKAKLTQQLRPQISLSLKDGASHAQVSTRQRTAPTPGRSSATNARS